MTENLQKNDKKRQRNDREMTHKRQRNDKEMAEK